MAGIIHLNGKTIMVGSLLALLAFTGCEGSDSREQVDNTVEEFAGKKKVDQMKAMERDIGDIQDQQSDRFKELDDMDDDEE
jgi:hypothetical protein